MKLYINLVPIFPCVLRHLLTLRPPSSFLGRKGRAMERGWFRSSRHGAELCRHLFHWELGREKSRRSHLRLCISFLPLVGFNFLLHSPHAFNTFGNWKEALSAILKCGAQTSTFSITWGLVGNADYQAPPRPTLSRSLEVGPRICVSTSPPVWEPPS